MRTIPVFNGQLCPNWLSYTFAGILEAVVWTVNRILRRQKLCGKLLLIPKLSWFLNWLFFKWEEDVRKATAYFKPLLLPCSCIGGYQHCAVVLKWWSSEKVKLNCLHRCIVNQMMAMMGKGLPGSFCKLCLHMHSGLWTSTYLAISQPLQEVCNHLTSSKP